MSMCICCLFYSPTVCLHVYSPIVCTVCLYVCCLFYSPTVWRALFDWVAHSFWREQCPELGAHVSFQPAEVSVFIHIYLEFLEFEPFFPLWVQLVLERPPWADLVWECLLWHSLGCQACFFLKVGVCQWNVAALWTLETMVSSYSHTDTVGPRSAGTQAVAKMWWLLP